MKYRHFHRLTPHGNVSVSPLLNPVLNVRKWLGLL